MIKPVVYFASNVKNFVVRNMQAEVIALNHPNFPEETPVTTSKVIKVNEDGSFETKNTIYIPKEI